MLHRRAAELLDAAHNYEHAIVHALEAEAYELASQFILAAQEQMFRQGQVEKLTRWVDELPVTIMARSPELLLVRARLYCIAEEHSQVKSHYEWRPTCAWVYVQLFCSIFPRQLPIYSRLSI